VLPSGGGTSRFGSVRPASTAPSKDDQILNLCNERISVPELLFHPSDIGLRQMGVAEAIADIISKMDAASAAACLRNIVCCGGTSSIPNFSQRLLQVRHPRRLCRAHINVGVIGRLRRTYERWCLRRLKST
jgi:actin-related protein 6